MGCSSWGHKESDTAEVTEHSHTRVRHKIRDRFLTWPSDDEVRGTEGHED